MELRDNTYALKEVFEMFEAVGALITDEEKVFHLTESIDNERLSKRAVYHMVTIPVLAGDF